MKSINVAVLGDKSVAEKLGKKGTTSDITLYNHKSGQQTIVAAYPELYPEKISSLLAALALSDTVVLCVDTPGPETGETIIALEALQKTKGLIVSPDYVYEQLKDAFKNTVVEKYEAVEKEKVYEKISETKIERDPSGKSLVEVDHCFEVKSVGTVALGTVRKGKISVHDTLEAHPCGKKALIKSIQMQDDNAETASQGDRVGLALKGVSPKELERGDVLGEAETAKKTTLLFKQNPYAKTSLEKETGFHLSTSLVYKHAKIVERKQNTLTLEYPNPVAQWGAKTLFCKPDLAMPRIVGTGEKQ